LKWVQEYKDGTGDKPFQYFRETCLPAGVEFEHSYTREAPVELTAFSEYESFLGGGSCIGGGGTGAARLNPSFQVVTEVNGCLITHQPARNMSADSLSYSGLALSPGGSSTSNTPILGSTISTISQAFSRKTV
jgi:hypothetical protein